MPDITTTEAPTAPTPVGIENIALGDIIGEGVRNGAQTFQIAEAVKAWRADATDYGKSQAAKTNPDGFWIGTARMDADVNDALAALRLDEINNRINALGYTNPDDKRGFLERLDSADGNPNSTALSDLPAPSGATEKLVASDIQKLAAHPAFKLDTNLSYGNSIDVGGNTLARFSLRDSGKGNVDALVTFDKPVEVTGKQIFPTKHPSAKNKDGSQSNVLMAGVGLDGKEYVIPTMVDGKELSIDEAVAVARKNGLGNYPSFSTPEEATKFAQENHGSIDENGFLKAPPKMESAIVTLKDINLPSRIKEQEAKIESAKKRVADAETMAKGAEKMAAMSEAGVGAMIGTGENTKYAEQDLQNQQAILAGLKSKNGRTFALNLDLQEELKKPEYEAKMGDKNLWGDFVSGAKSAIISSGIAVERAREVAGIDGGNMSTLREGLRDLSLSDPGSTQRTFQGGLLNQTTQGAVNSLGSMSLTVLPTGALSRAVTGGMEKMLAKELVANVGYSEAKAAALAKGQFGELGEAASASAMGPMSYGSEYARMLDQADNLQKTDPELANKLRGKADIAALMQASIDFGTELIGEGHNPFLQRSGFANFVRKYPGSVAKEGLEEVAAGALERGVKQPIALDGTKEANQPITQGMAAEFATGAAAAVPLIATGALSTGDKTPGSVEADGMHEAPPIAPDIKAKMDAEKTAAPAAPTPPTPESFSEPPPVEPDGMHEAPPIAPDIKAKMDAENATASEAPAGETNTVPPPPGSPTPESFSKSSAPEANELSKIESRLAELQKIHGPLEKPAADFTPENPKMEPYRIATTEEAQLMARRDAITAAQSPEQAAQAEKDSAILHDSAAHGLLLLGGVGPTATEERITLNALALMQGTKESADSLAAQIDMMVDPSKPKTAVFIDEGTPDIQEPIMAAVEAAKVKHGVEGDFGLVKVEGGMVLFDKAAHPNEQDVVTMANAGILGQALGYGVASKPDVVSEENRAKLLAEEAAGLKGTDLQQKALAALTILLQSPGQVEKAAVVTDGTPEEVQKVKEALQKLAAPTDAIVMVPAAQMPDVIAQREQHKADLTEALKRKQAAQTTKQTMELDASEEDPFAVAIPSAPLTPSTTPSAPIAPIKSISQIIRDLAAGLDLPIRFGRLTSRNFGGYFKKLANLIGAKRANDIPTVAHEVGHKLDALFNIAHNPAIRAELDTLGDPATPGSMSSWTKSKTLAYKYGEGVGEFVRHYLTDPAKALADAPQTFAYFNGILDANPDFGDVMRQAQADIRNWRNAPFEARLDSSISVGSNPNKSRYRLAQLTRDLVDDLHIIRLAVDDVEKVKGKLKPSENPYLLARLLRGSYGMADTFLRHGTVNFTTRAVTPGTSLEHALKPVAGRIDAFRRWIVAKRAKELHAQGKETGLDRGDVDLTVAKYDADPVFQKAFADIKAWNDSLLQYAVDAGYITKEGADAMRAMHQDYVPMHRVFEIGAGESPSQEGAGAGRGLNVGTVGSFRRLGGSTRDIVDPLETMVRNAYSIITASEKTAINKAIGDLSAKHGMGGWVEKIATPKEALKAPLEKIREQLEDAGADLTGVPDDLILQFFRDSSNAPYGENIIRVTHAGTTTFYRLNSDLYDSFHALDMEQAGMLLKIASAPAQLLRSGVTLDPSFGAANLIRDAFGSAVINRYRLFPFEAGLKGAIAMVGSPGLVAQWAASGADNSMEVNFFDREATASFLREKITKQLTPAERALIFVKGPLSALRWMSAKTEEATRLGEYKTALEHHLSEGMAPGEARRLAAFESRDRQDFAKGGAKTKSLRRAAAFWNAGLQANVAIYHAFKERPVRSTIQGLMYITAPTLAILAANWDDKDYWDRPQWERDVFWLVPHGKDNLGHTKFLRIPKPFILGIMFGALPERMYAWAKKNDPKAFDGFATQVRSEIQPNPFPQTVTLLYELNAGKRGWDYFRKREIVPESLADLPATLQWTEQTSLTARKIGDLLDVSPMKIDHIIATTTGGLGRQLVHQVIDRAIESATGEKRTATSTEPGGRFFATPAGINSKAVEDFYTALTDLREKKAGAKHEDAAPKPAHQTKRAKQKAAETLGAQNDYDYKHLQLMERASRDISDVRDKIGGVSDPDAKQKLYLQIKDIAEKAMADKYKAPVAKSRRKAGGIGF